MTYNVFGGTLNLAQSLNLDTQSWLPCPQSWQILAEISLL